MNTLIIYKSTTGFTKKYAQWIAEALSCQTISAEKASNISLDSYDAIVYGSWLFAGNIKDFKDYRGKIANFSGKKAVFVVGSTKPDTPQAFKILEDCFTETERQNTGAFYMPGGLNYTRMGAIHKFMMKMMCHMLKKQKGVDSIEYKTISQSFDATDKTAIQPLISYLTKK